MLFVLIVEKELERGIMSINENIISVNIFQ